MTALKEVRCGPTVRQPAPSKLTGTADSNGLPRQRLYDLPAFGLAQSTRFAYPAVEPAVTPYYGLVSEGRVEAGGVVPSLFQVCSHRFCGARFGEDQRVILGAIRLFEDVAVVAVLLQRELDSGCLAIAPPAGLVGMRSDRWVWRSLVMRIHPGVGLPAVALVVGCADALVRTELTREQHIPNHNLVSRACALRSAGCVDDSIELDGGKASIRGGDQKPQSRV